MHCEQAKPLLHGLIDNEVDSRVVSAHIRRCRRCAAELAQFRAMRAAMLKAPLRLSAPPRLSAAIMWRLASTAVPAASKRTPRRWFAWPVAWSVAWPLTRPTAWRIAWPSLAPVLSAATAALFMFAVLGSGSDEVLVSDVVSAHMRSLEANRLTDLQTDDTGVVKPWLSRRLGVAPPIPDLRAQGFTLVGSRVDYVLGKPVAAIAYRQSGHIVNLFIAQGAGAERDARMKSMQGLNVELWSQGGLNLCVVGNVSPDQLQAVHDAFAASAAKI